MQAEALILMYHDLASHRRTAHSGNLPYVLDPDTFRGHLDAVLSAGLQVTTVGGWVLGRDRSGAFRRNRAGPELILTFDDGDSSNHERALPLLLKKGLTATFFVTVGRIGTAGALSWPQLVDLHRAGMEIGSHTMTHRAPILLSDTELRYELIESKARLEDGLAARILSISSPTGFFNPRMSDLAREVGYSALCGGRMAPVRRRDSSYNLPRIAIKRSLTSAEFEKILRLSRPLFVRLRGEQVARNALKKLLGPHAYMRLRRLLLGIRAGQ